MRDAIAGSIRQAKYQVNKFNNVELELSQINNGYIVDGNHVQQINNNSVIIEAQNENLNNNHSREHSVDKTDY